MVFNTLLQNFGRMINFTNTVQNYVVLDKYALTCWISGVGYAISGI